MSGDIRQLTFALGVVVVVFLALVTCETLKVGHTVTGPSVIVACDAIGPVVVTATRYRNHTHSQQPTSLPLVVPTSNCREHLQNHSRLHCIYKYVYKYTKRDTYF